MMSAALASFMGLFYLITLGISIYCLVLFIKLAHRGIKALDIYIDKEQYKIKPAPGELSAASNDYTRQ